MGAAETTLAGGTMFRRRAKENSATNKYPSVAGLPTSPGTIKETPSAVPCTAISIRSHCRPTSDAGVCEEERVGR
jgi:hypothetical protein